MGNEYFEKYYESASKKEKILIETNRTLCSEAIVSGLDILGSKGAAAYLESEEEKLVHKMSILSHGFNVGKIEKINENYELYRKTSVIRKLETLGISEYNDNELYIDREATSVDLERALNSFLSRISDFDKDSTFAYIPTSFIPIISQGQKAYYVEYSEYLLSFFPSKVLGSQAVAHRNFHFETISPERRVQQIIAQHEHYMLIPYGDNISNNYILSLMYEKFEKRRGHASDTINRYSYLEKGKDDSLYYLDVENVMSEGDLTLNDLKNFCFENKGFLEATYINPYKVYICALYDNRYFLPFSSIGTYEFKSFDGFVPSINLCNSIYSTLAVSGSEKVRDSLIFGFENGLMGNPNDVIHERIMSYYIESLIEQKKNEGEINPDVKISPFLSDKKMLERYESEVNKLLSKQAIQSQHSITSHLMLIEYKDIKVLYGEVLTYSLIDKHVLKYNSFKIPPKVSDKSLSSNDEIFIVVDRLHVSISNNNKENFFYEINIFKEIQNTYEIIITNLKQNYSIEKHYALMKHFKETHQSAGLGRSCPYDNPIYVDPFIEVFARDHITSHKRSLSFINSLGLYLKRLNYEE